LNGTVLMMTNFPEEGHVISHNKNAVRQVQTNKTAFTT